MKKIYEIALSALMLLALAGCTLMLDVMPEEEEPQEEVDLDKVGFDEPYTMDVEDMGDVTYQYGDSTKIFVREMFDYIVDVKLDSVIVLSDNVPQELLIQPGYYVSRMSCLEFPYGLMHRVTNLVHRNGTYEMYIEPAKQDDVFKEVRMHITTSVDFGSGLPEDINDSLFEEVKEEAIPERGVKSFRMKKASDPVYGKHVDWSDFKRMPKPISTKSPFSRKLKRLTTRVTENLEPIESNERVIKVELSDGMLKWYLMSDTDFKYEINLKDLIKNEKVKNFLHAVNWGFEITSKKVTQVQITEEPQMGKDGKNHSWKQVITDVDEKLTFTLDGDYVLSNMLDIIGADKVGATGEDATLSIRDYINKETQAGTISLGKWYSKRKWVNVGPVPIPLTFRGKYAPDIVAGIKGKLQVDFDNGETQGTVQYLDGEEIDVDDDQKTVTIRKPTGFKSWRGSFSAYVKMSVAMDFGGGVSIEGGPVVKNDGRTVKIENSVNAGFYAGLHVEPYVTLTYTGFMGDDDTRDTDYINENYAAISGDIDIYGKSGFYVDTFDGDEKNWFGVSTSTWTIPLFNRNMYPDFVNLSPIIGVKDQQHDAGNYNMLNASYQFDRMGLDYDLFTRESVKRRLLPAVNIYEIDGSGNIVGEPVYRLIGDQMTDYGMHSFSRELLPSQKNMEFVMVPTIYDPIDRPHFREYRYAATRFSKEKSVELRPMDLVLLKSSENEQRGQYKFDFMINTYNVDMISKVGWTQVAAVFGVWRYDKAMDHWKLIGRMRKEFKDMLQPGKIAYDLIGQFEIQYTDEEKENKDNFEFYLTAGLFHELHSGGFYDFIHLVKGGVSSYERMDRYTTDPDAYSFRIKLVDGAEGESRGLTIIDIKTTSGNIK